MPVHPVLRNECQARHRNAVACGASGRRVGTVRHALNESRGRETGLRPSAREERERVADALQNVGRVTPEFAVAQRVRGGCEGGSQAHRCRAPDRVGTAPQAEELRRGSLREGRRRIGRCASGRGRRTDRLPRPKNRRGPANEPLPARLNRQHQRRSPLHRRWEVEELPHGLEFGNHHHAHHVGVVVSPRVHTPK